METTELMNLKKNPLTYLNILMGISLWVGLFHILILVRVIPFEITWGGRLKVLKKCMCLKHFLFLFFRFSFLYYYKKEDISVLFGERKQ